jgi:hypothetical protein
MAAENKQKYTVTHWSGDRKDADDEPVKVVTELVASKEYIAGMMCVAYVCTESDNDEGLQVSLVVELEGKVLRVAEYVTPYLVKDQDDDAKILQNVRGKKGYVIEYAYSFIGTAIFYCENRDFLDGMRYGHHIFVEGFDQAIETVDHKGQPIEHRAVGILEIEIDGITTQPEELYPDFVYTIDGKIHVPDASQDSDDEEPQPAVMVQPPKQ